MSATENLLIGPAKIFIGPANSTDIDGADFADLKAGILPEGWRYAGDTTTGVEFKNVPEYVTATSQQALRDLDVAVSKEKSTFASTAREITTALLKDMVRGASTTTGSVTTVTPGGLGSTPKFSVALLGAWPNGDSLVVAPRCTFAGEYSISHSSSEFASVAFEIEILETTATGYAHGWKQFLSTAS